MPRRLSAMLSLTRRPALIGLATILLGVLLAACGSTSQTGNTQDYNTDRHPLTQTPYCAKHPYPTAASVGNLSNSTDNLDFWRSRIIVVGLASSDGSAVTATASDVANVVGQFLQACFPNAGIKVNPVDSAQPPLVAIGHTALAFLAINTDTNDIFLSNAQLTAAIDAINSSDQALDGRKVEFPLIDAHRLIGSAKTAKTANTIIVGASPDWGMNGQGIDSGGFGGGSPEGSPTLFSGNPTITQSETGSGKTIYVLDTVPPILQQSAGTLGHTNITSPVSAYCASSPLCASFSFLQSGGPIDVTDQVMPNERAFLCKTLPCDSSAPAPTSEISKHGFFVSALIHNLAPGATIHLVRVLDDFGVGDFMTLTAALGRIATSEQAPTNAIINMSLSIEPPLDCLIPLWQNGVSKMKVVQSSSNASLDLASCGSTTLGVLEGTEGTSGNSDLFQRRLLLPMTLLIESMLDQHFTIVAAAGNDSTGPTERFSADMPAAICGVYAAAASASQGSGAWQYSGASQLADFSNYPYVKSNSGAGERCVSAPTDRNAASFPQLHIENAMAPANSIAAPGENICSVYLHAADGRDPNDSGSAAGEWLATWQGTSFATALVSGDLAAGAGGASWAFAEPCQPPSVPQ